MLISPFVPFSACLIFCVIEGKGDRKLLLKHPNAAAALVAKLEVRGNFLKLSLDTGNDNNTLVYSTKFGGQLSHYLEVTTFSTSKQSSTQQLLISSFRPKRNVSLIHPTTILAHRPQTLNQTIPENIVKASTPAGIFPNYKPLTILEMRAAVCREGCFRCHLISEDDPKLIHKSFTTPSISMDSSRSGSDLVACLKKCLTDTIDFNLYPRLTLPIQPCLDRNVTTLERCLGWLSVWSPTPQITTTIRVRGIRLAGRNVGGKWRNNPVGSLHYEVDNGATTYSTSFKRLESATKRAIQTETNDWGGLIRYSSLSDDDYQVPVTTTHVTIRTADRAHNLSFLSYDYVLEDESTSSLPVSAAKTLAARTERALVEEPDYTKLTYFLNLKKRMKSTTDVKSSYESHNHSYGKYNTFVVDRVSVCEETCGTRGLSGNIRIMCRLICHLNHGTMNVIDQDFYDFSINNCVAVCHLCKEINLIPETGVCVSDCYNSKGRYRMCNVELYNGGKYRAKTYCAQFKFCKCKLIEKGLLRFECDPLLQKASYIVNALNFYYYVYHKTNGTLTTEVLVEEMLTQLLLTIFISDKFYNHQNPLWPFPCCIYNYQRNHSKFLLDFNYKNTVCKIELKWSLLEVDIPKNNEASLWSVC